MIEGHSHHHATTEILPRGWAEAAAVRLVVVAMQTVWTIGVTSYRVCGRKWTRPVQSHETTVERKRNTTNAEEAAPDLFRCPRLRCDLQLRCPHPRRALTMTTATAVTLRGLRTNDTPTTPVCDVGVETDSGAETPPGMLIFPHLPPRLRRFPEQAKAGAVLQPPPAATILPLPLLQWLQLAVASRGRRRLLPRRPPSRLHRSFCTACCGGGGGIVLVVVPRG